MDDSPSFDSATPQRRSLNDSKSHRSRIRLTYEPGQFVVPREQLLQVPPSEGANYEAGDIIWAKIHNYPWWPCMITVDPTTSKYTKEQQLKDGSIQIDYHVQYFGLTAYRGYTTGQIMPYEGKEKYETHLDNVKNTPVSDRARRLRELNKYSIKPGMKRSWTTAADEADEAVELSREQRIQQLTFEYILVSRFGQVVSETTTVQNETQSAKKRGRKPKSDKMSDSSYLRESSVIEPFSASKRKNESSPTVSDPTPKRGRGRPKGSSNVKPKSGSRARASGGGGVLNTSKSDVYDFDDDEFIDTTPTKPLMLFSAKRVNKGEFPVYASQHRAQLVKDNPELDEDEIEQHLQRKWDLLADDQRNLYVLRRSYSSSKTSENTTAHSPLNRLKSADTLRFSEDEEDEDERKKEKEDANLRKRKKMKKNDGEDFGQPSIALSSKPSLKTYSRLNSSYNKINRSSIDDDDDYHPSPKRKLSPKLSQPTKKSRRNSHGDETFVRQIDSLASQTPGIRRRGRPKKSQTPSQVAPSDVGNEKTNTPDVIERRRSVSQRTTSLTVPARPARSTRSTSLANQPPSYDLDEKNTGDENLEPTSDTENTEPENFFDAPETPETPETPLKCDEKDISEEHITTKPSTTSPVIEDVSKQSDKEEDEGEELPMETSLISEDNQSISKAVLGQEDDDTEEEEEEEGNEPPSQEMQVDKEKFDEEEEEEKKVVDEKESSDEKEHAQVDHLETKLVDEQQSETLFVDSPQPQTKSVDDQKPEEAEQTATVSRNDVETVSNAESEEIGVTPTITEPLLTTASSSSSNGNSSDSASLSESDQMQPVEKQATFCGRCFKVEKGDSKAILLKCNGSCQLSFHRQCLEVCDPENNVQTCTECKTGQPKCFVCKQHSADVKKCSMNKCAKVYHLKCLEKKFPIKLIASNQEFKCPLHFCLTCYGQHQDDNVFRYINKKTFTCIRCPTAYHQLNSCLAAGSVSVDSRHIICPDHAQPSSKRRHVNVSWCFSCNMGGNLVCCELCPTAFHADCLEYKLPEGKFYCSSCFKRHQLLYGDVVWVKLGSYRWWPGMIQHPNDVPINIRNMKHDVGDFPVFFFGSHDYYWVNLGRSFLYMEGDEERSISCRSSMDKTFKLAMEEAVTEFQRWKEDKKTDLGRKTVKPPPYNHIKINKPYGKFKQPWVDDHTNEQQFHPCGCDDSDPCTSDTNCMNRLMMYECDAKICANGEKCKNQRFKRREYVKASPFKVEAGWGLKTSEAVSKGQFVIEYVGELIDEDECNRRLKERVERHDSNFYFLTIDRDTIIDAGPKGNLARFMNHSCNPNCETQKWVVNNQTRVGLFAVEDIPANTELTFNYNLESRGHEKIKCLCGAENCSGFIGLQPKKLIPSTLANGDESTSTARKMAASSSAKKKKTLKPQFASLHEDECFRCGEAGTLVMCDVRFCPKAYHLKCLGLDKIPNGRWTCPWHHCDVCGRLATPKCDFCPVSLCKPHLDETKLELLSNGRYLCFEHVDRSEVRTYLLTLPAKQSPAASSTEDANGDSSSENSDSLKNRSTTNSGESRSQISSTTNSTQNGNNNKKAQDRQAYQLERAARLQRRSKANEQRNAVEMPVHKTNDKDGKKVGKVKKEEPMVSDDEELHDASPEPVEMDNRTTAEKELEDNEGEVSCEEDLYSDAQDDVTVNDTSVGDENVEKNLNIDSSKLTNEDEESTKIVRKSADSSGGDELSLKNGITEMN